MLTFMINKKLLYTRALIGKGTSILINIGCLTNFFLCLKMFLFGLWFFYGDGKRCDLSFSSFKSVFYREY